VNIKIVPFTAEHEKAVRAFNARLAASHLDHRLYSTRFPVSHVSKWLPKRPGRDLYQEYFIAVDEQSMVRGGYILKHQPFLLKGEPMQLVAYQLPISEGVIDRKYASVAVSLYMDALRRYPQLWGLGGGGYHTPNLRFLLKAQWQTTLVPFWFRIVHPNAFLQNIAFLRNSFSRQIALDILRYSGLGWLGIKTLKGVQGKHRRPAGVFYETVGDFSEWADDVWDRCKNDYALIAVRNRPILDILYPATPNSRFIRLKVMRDRQIIGWAVLLNTPMVGHRQFGNMQVGTLVDCLAKPEDARDVVACAQEVLESSGSDLIVSNQCSHAWCQALRCCGFLRGPSNFPFLASPVFATRLQPLKELAVSFHLNRGDGDGPRNM
jgi:hypothetical protein